MFCGEIQKNSIKESTKIVVGKGNLFTKDQESKLHQISQQKYFKQKTTQKQTQNGWKGVDK